MFVFLPAVFLQCTLLCLFVGMCDAVSWQLGLVEREINELLQGSINRQTQRSSARQPAAAHTENKVGPAAGTVPQREISDDDICPVCQEELLANHQPVTFCRLAQLCLAAAFIVNHWTKIYVVNNKCKSDATTTVLFAILEVMFGFGLHVYLCSFSICG